MPRPEGYRKALRLMRLAEKFGLPVFTFVDTPGAYPGVGAEERGPVRGDRPQPLRDGAAARADRHAR
jgi:acetyl-CoA carboxylase alpha subunit